MQCNEAKPQCEYCQHTRRTCVYRDVGTEISPGIKKGAARDQDVHSVFHDKPESECQVKSVVPRLPRLGLSPFEWNLYHFFNTYCIPLFTFAANDSVDSMWRLRTPRLFAGSRLVRQAVFLFAAINMWPLCDRRTLFFEDVRSPKLREVDSESPNSEEVPSSDDFAALQPRTESLYLMTLLYFSEVLAETRGVLLQSEPSTSETGAELVTSGLLMYLFLAIHPHRLVPLLSCQTDEECSAETPLDFVAICRGLQNTCHKYSVQSGRANFQYFSFTPEKVPGGGFSRIVLVRVLKGELAVFFDQNDVSVRNADREVLLRTIDLLGAAIYFAVAFNYPIPLYKWPLALPEQFDSLLRRKHYFALKLYFTFACICIFSGLKLYHATNMWRDYVQWFHSYCKQRHGRWLYETEKYLYLLVVAGYRFSYGNLAFLPEFDPQTALYGFRQAQP